VKTPFGKPIEAEDRPQREKSGGGLLKKLTNKLNVGKSYPPYPIMTCEEVGVTGRPPLWYVGNGTRGEAPSLSPLAPKGKNSGKEGIKEGDFCSAFNC